MLFRSGRYRIRLDGKIGYADEETGAIVVAPVYDCAFPFKDEMCIRDRDLDIPMITQALKQRMKP